MENPVIRIRSMQIKNIKNVKNGIIKMPACTKKSFSYESPEVLGIYGQNGSGKTAVIDTFYFLQQLMTGKKLSSEIYDYINQENTHAEIITTFIIFSQAVTYQVDYKITLQKTDNHRVTIARETLSSRKQQANSLTPKSIFMDYHANDNKHIFSPSKQLITLSQYIDPLDLLVAKKIAAKSNCSFIFGENSRDLFFRDDFKDDFKEYAFLIEQLYNFAQKDLFVIRSVHSGVISANIALPMAFRNSGQETSVKGDFSVPLNGAIILDQKNVDLLHRIITEINTVLDTIIPSLQLGIVSYGPQLTDSGAPGEKLELISRRDTVDIPIRMESEGIIKLISILNVLIQAFSDYSICLVIDELDSGIFEYLLGELLDIFNHHAKGQLLFTSHNLRALEMLTPESVLFSTANPQNRYIHIKNKKTTANLRDTYLRSISLGGQKDEIYSNTDSLKIARAFRKAGRNVKNNYGTKNNSLHC